MARAVWEGHIWKIAEANVAASDITATVVTEVAVLSEVVAVHLCKSLFHVTCSEGTGDEGEENDCGFHFVVKFNLVLIISV